MASSRKSATEQPPNILRKDAVALVRQLEETVNAHDMDKLLGFYSASAVTVSTVYGVLAGRAAIGNKLGGHIFFRLGLDCERGTARRFGLSSCGRGRRSGRGRPGMVLPAG